MFKTRQVNAKLEWSLYTEALETEKFYLLVYGKGAISVIPKRVLTTTRQEELFRKLVARRIGSERQPGKMEGPPRAWKRDPIMSRLWSHLIGAKH